MCMCITRKRLKQFPLNLVHMRRNRERRERYTSYMKNQPYASEADLLNKMIKICIYQFRVGVGGIQKERIDYRKVLGLFCHFQINEKFFWCLLLPVVEYHPVI